MKTVSVHASRSYEIRIGRGLLQGAGEQIRAVTDAKKVMLVSDDAVWPLYGGAVRRSLETAGLTVCSFVFPHGESSKCACTYLELLDALCAQQLTRKDAIAALGGGHRADILKSNMVCFNTRKHSNESIYYNVGFLEDEFSSRKRSSSTTSI